MIVKLDTHCLQTLGQVREFLAGSRPLDQQPQTRAEAYAFVAETLQRFDYPRQGKADKGLIRRFLVKVTGLSRAQVTRLLHRHRTTGAITDRRGPRRPSLAATPRLPRPRPRESWSLEASWNRELDHVRPWRSRAECAMCVVKSTETRG